MDDMSVKENGSDLTVAYLQDPINGHNEGYVIGWEANWGQHDHHGDQSSLGDACSSNACSGGCDAGEE